MGRFKMVSAGALTIFSGKNIIIICGSETPAGVSEPLFHRWGRNGKRHLQRRFLRKRGAAVSVLALSGANAPALPKGEPLAWRYSFRLNRKACGRARSPERADFPRPGEDVTAGDKRGELSRSD